VPVRRLLGWGLRAGTNLLGEQRPVGVGLDQGGDRVALSVTPHDEPVAPVEWLRRHKPMRLRMPGWWEDGELRALVDPRVAAAFDARFGP